MRHATVLNFCELFFPRQIFNDASDEEDSPPKPTAIGRLGRPIDPADRSKIYLGFIMIIPVTRDRLFKARY